MLRENEDVISFRPGTVDKGRVALGRIVVHDRLKVEANVLPRYFNHSSFASLRRQLNYFSFTRLGKGRQRGATYCNEGVMVLEDILRLKRRSTTANHASNSIKTAATAAPSHLEDTRRSVKRAPRVSISSMEEVTEPVYASIKRARHATFQKISTYHQTVSDSEDSTQSERDHKPNQRHRIALDLTIPFLKGEDDVLAGCHALLSFSRAAVHWADCSVLYLVVRCIPTYFHNHLPLLPSQRSPLHCF